MPSYNKHTTPYPFDTTQHSVRLERKAMEMLTLLTYPGMYAGPALLFRRCNSHSMANLWLSGLYAYGTWITQSRGLTAFTGI